MNKNLKNAAMISLLSIISILFISLKTTDVSASTQNHNNAEQLNMNYYQDYDLLTTKDNKDANKIVFLNKNILCYKHIKFSKKNAIQKLYKGQFLNLKKIIRSGNVTRIMLYDNTYITGNKNIVKII